MITEDKLEKLKKLADAMYYAAQQLTTDASRLYEAMDEYRQFIINEYHKEEPVSEDLEKEFDDIYYQLEKVDAQNDGFGGRYKGYKFALKIARHFANWQKEQMMAKAVDATVHIDAGGYPYIPQIELYDYDKDIPLAKEGDKYKIILIKEG